MRWVLIVLGSVVALVVLIALIGAFLPREHVATSTITLRQTPDSVWKVIRDFGAITTWWPDMKESARLPDQSGQEAWRQKVSGFDMPLVVMESSPPRRLVTKIDAGNKAVFGGTWTYELTPNAGGTRISVTEAGWIRNPIFRFLSRFAFGYYGSLDGYLTALSRKFGEDVKPIHS